LNKAFIPQYKDAMNAVDHAVVYFDPKVVEHKRLPELDATFVRDAFGRESLEILTSPEALEARLDRVPRKNHVLLMMSSGRFGGAVFSPTPRQATSSQ
jgi:UDP-N-acetylmuramate: L-alanyl-gamma-D-glutamyl-meso-diaminopimelate ligase